MPITIPIIFSLAPIPVGQALDANQYGQMLVANLQASITANFLTGQTSGPEPSSNVGPWFNGSSWWSWNTSSSEYLPLPTSYLYNPVINACMQIWQRGILFPSIADGQTIYTADRWLAASAMLTGTATVSSQALNLTGTAQYPDTQSSLRITVVTPQTTIATGEYFVITQKIERGMARPLFDNVTSLSIVLQSSVIGTYCVSIHDADNSWSYVMECAVATPSVPQYFTFPSIPAFPTTSGNWGVANTDACYYLSVTATCGATFQGLPNTWNASNQLADTNQTNLFANTGNTLDITLVQHEPSPISNPFLFVPYDLDLIRCQRYYCKSHPASVYPLTFNLSTSATTALGGNVLTFASTTSPGIAAVAIGMQVFSAGIGIGSTVTNVSPTTVTITPVTTLGITLGQSISFFGGVSSINELAFITILTTQAWGVARFPVKMRTVPSLTFWSPLHGYPGQVMSDVQVADVPVSSSATLGETGFDLVATTNSWTSPANAIRFHYTANAEL